MSLLNPDQTPEAAMKSAMEANEAALTRSPFAGFLIRLFAFFIDGLVIFAVGGMIVRSLGPAVYRLNPWLPWEGLLLGFIYFFWSCSPLARGRTLGMAVMGIHIVGRDGSPPGWFAALRRTLVQFVGIYGLLALTAANLAYYLLAFPPAARYGALLGMVFISLFGVTLLIALCLSISIHPHKRGWHDLIAGTFVTRDPTPARFREVLAAPPDVLTERRLANHPMMTVPLWIVGLGILCFGTFQPFLTGQFLFEAKNAREFNEGLLAGTDLSVVNVVYPSTQDLERFREGVEKIRSQVIAAGKDVPTTETIRLQSAIDGETILLVAMQARGNFPENGLDDAAFRARMERARGEAWKSWQVYRDTWKEKTKQDLPPANRFFVILQQQSQLLFNNQNRMLGSVEGPANPSGGALAFKAPLTTGTLASPSAAPPIAMSTTGTLTAK